MVKTEGDSSRWELELSGKSDLSGAQMMDHLTRSLAQGKWSEVDGTAATGSATLASRWKFSGRDGRPWTGIVKVEPVAGKAGENTTRLTIARSG